MGTVRVAAETNITHHTSHQSRWSRTSLSRPCVWTASSLDPHGALRWRRLTPFHESQSRARFAAIEERRKERIRSSLLSSRSTAAFFAKKKESRVRRSGCQTAAAAGIVVGVAPGTTTGLLGVPVVVACHSHSALRRDSQSPRPPTNDCNNAATAAVSNVGRSPPGSVFSRGHLGFIISVRALLVETSERWRRWRVVGPCVFL
jgi:hypothetical protein